MKVANTYTNRCRRRYRRCQAAEAEFGCSAACRPGGGGDGETEEGGHSEDQNGPDLAHHGARVEEHHDEDEDRDEQDLMETEGTPFLALCGG